MTQPWRSILVAVSDPFRREQTGVAKAAALAAGSNVKLTLFNSFMIPQPTPDAPLGNRKQIIASARKQRLERMDKLAEPLRARGLKVECKVDWDYPTHTAIIKATARSKAELVVTDSHRHGRLARWLLSNTDWELIRQCPRPIWFARTAKWPVTPRVAVALDPFHPQEEKTRMDERLLTTAEELTSHVGGSILLVHAAAEGHPKPEAQEKVAESARNCSVRPERIHVATGAPESVIGGFTQKQRVDVLLMGVLSRSLAGGVIGHTAERVIDHVGCDLLVLKPPSFKAPTHAGKSTARQSGA